VWQRQQEGPWDWAGLWKQVQWELSLGNSVEWEEAGPLQKAFRQVGGRLQAAGYELVLLRWQCMHVMMYGWEGSVFRATLHNAYCSVHS
jgi:hypothetical protein